MDGTGDNTLENYPRRTLAFVCKGCGRRGRYRKTTLILQFGAKTGMAGFAHLVARWRGCPYVDNPVLGATRWCEIRLDVDLAGEMLQKKRQEEARKHWR